MKYLMKPRRNGALVFFSLRLSLKDLVIWREPTPSRISVGIFPSHTQSQADVNASHAWRSTFTANHSPFLLNIIRHTVCTANHSPKDTLCVLHMQSLLAKCPKSRWKYPNTVCAKYWIQNVWTIFFSNEDCKDIAVILNTFTFFLAGIHQKKSHLAPRALRESE